MIQLNTQNSLKICAVLAKVLESTSFNAAKMTQAIYAILIKNFISIASKPSSNFAISSAVYANKMKALYMAYCGVAIARKKMLQGI